MSVVIKIKFGEDIRRFTVAEDSTFENFCKTLKHHYHLAGESITVKYYDDENDLITISNTVELKEAITFIKTQTPPVLRIIIIKSNNNNNNNNNVIAQITEAEKEVEEVEKEEKIDTTNDNIEDNDTKEYAPLSINDWDAPSKIPQQQPKQISKNKTISEQTAANSAATLLDVLSFSDSTVADTNRFSAEIISLLQQDSAKMENTLLCADLSKKSLLIVLHYPERHPTCAIR